MDRDPEFEKRLRAFAAREWGDIRKRLKVDMTGLENHLRIGNATDFSQRFGIPRARVEQLEEDSWHEMARAHLFKLIQLEGQVRRTNAEFRFFQEEPNPIWQTFDNKRGVGLTGIDLEGDPIRIDQTIIAGFWNADVILSPPAPGADVRQLMQTENCVIVGSPKVNRATEIALEALFPDSLGVAFHWPGWPEGRKETRASRQGPLRVDYLDHRGKPVFFRDSSPERPTGAVVICRSPLGTPAPVTTVIAAGCTKYGTLQAVRDLLAGVVYVPSSRLVPNRPLVLVLMPKDAGKRWYCADVKRELLMKRRDRRKQNNHNEPAEILPPSPSGSSAETLAGGNTPAPVATPPTTVSVNARPPVARKQPPKPSRKTSTARSTRSKTKGHKPASRR